MTTKRPGRTWWASYSIRCGLCSETQATSVPSDSLPFDHSTITQTVDLVLQCNIRQPRAMLRNGTKHHSKFMLVATCKHGCRDHPRQPPSGKKRKPVDLPGDRLQGEKGDLTDLKTCTPPRLTGAIRREERTFRPQ